ncbi:MAG: glycine/sarcosine/betaine reductase component B subunit, partial [Oscillospiraceae bacterium]
MKLTLDYTNIKDIQFGDKTKIEKGVLTINQQELKDRILKDP